MAQSIVRMIVDLSNWIAFIIGITLNGLMIRLIIWHTPKSMRIYSKILLQTCATDLALLTMAFLFCPYTFTTENGEQGVFIGGLVDGWSTEFRKWHIIVLILWVFFIYVSLYGYVSQFIYRYLLLNWGKKISTCKYFVLFGIVLLVPFLYSFILYICYYPPDDHQFLEEQSVADIFGLNLTKQPVALAAYSVNNENRQVGFYYILSCSTLACTTMIILAFLIDKFLREQTKKVTTSSKLTAKMIEMNKQISRNLIIQASMPFFIYFSILFLLVIALFKIDVSRWYWLQYYNLLCLIPMFLPSALNPIVSICIIQSYRKVFVKDIMKTVKYFKQYVVQQPVQSVVELH